MKNVKYFDEYINESVNNSAVFDENSKIRMLGGREGTTTFTIDGIQIEDYATDKKSMLKLIKSVKNRDKIYVLSYNKIFGYWEGVLVSYYTNAYGKTNDELIGSSSDGRGIREEDIDYWTSSPYPRVLVKVA